MLCVSNCSVWMEKWNDSNIHVETETFGIGCANMLGGGAGINNYCQRVNDIILNVVWIEMQMWLSPVHGASTCWGDLRTTSFEPSCVKWKLRVQKSARWQCHSATCLWFLGGRTVQKHDFYLVFLMKRSCAECQSYIPSNLSKDKMACF